MFSFNKSLLPLANLGVLVIALTVLTSPAGSASTEKEKAPRKFYVTQTNHDGSQALSACASGYHMASLWEILDTSNLRYDTQLGLTRADSGSGPPTAFGWIRTGHVAAITDFAGFGNCNAYTSADSSHRGTIVTLSPVEWNSPARVVSPWDAASFECNLPLRVWCVQD
jgi:hypothetical protein